jgi:hypothetical protein
MCSPVGLHLGFWPSWGAVFVVGNGQDWAGTVAAAVSTSKAGGSAIVSTLRTARLTRAVRRWLIAIVASASGCRF